MKKQIKPQEHKNLPVPQEDALSDLVKKRYIFGWVNPRDVYGEPLVFSTSPWTFLDRVRGEISNIFGLVFPMILFAVGITMVIHPETFVTLIARIFK